MRLGFAIASVPLAVLIGFSLPATAEPDTHPLEISTDKTVSVINGASSAPMIAASRSSIASKPLVAPRSSIATTSATSDLNLDFTKGGSSAKPEASKLVKTKARKKAPRSARLVASVNLSSQRMTVTVDGDVKHVWKVSSGGRGYHTPTGSFTPVPHAHHVALTQIQQRQDALFGVLSGRLCGACNLCDQPPWSSCVARLCAAVSVQCA